MSTSKLQTPFTAACTGSLEGPEGATMNRHNVDSVGHPGESGVIDRKFVENLPVSPAALETPFSKGLGIENTNGSTPDVSTGSGGLSSSFTPAFGGKK